MNKLSGILALLLLVGSTTLVAQGNNVRLDAQINWGEEYTEPSGSFLSKVVATQGEGFYALREKRVTGLTGELPNKIYLEYYHNRKMKMLKSREIDLRYKNKKRQLEEVMMLGGKLYLLTSFHNEAKKKNYLFYQKVSHRLTPSKTIVNVPLYPTHRHPQLEPQERPANDWRDRYAGCTAGRIL